MSEFPSWVERALGTEQLSYGAARELRRQVEAGLWPDPRGRGRRIWWRWWWPFNRRRARSVRRR